MGDCQLLNESNKYCSGIDREPLLIPYYQAPNLSAQIQALCQKFFNLHKLCFFSFYRIYDDGTCILLSSSASSLEYVFKHSIHVTPHIPSNIIKEKYWYIIPGNTIYKKFLDDFREMFDSNVIFDYIERNEGYYEVSYFASYCEAEIATTHFLNYKEEFEKFSHYFRHHSASLISCYENKKIILPLKMRSNISGLNRPINHKEGVLLSSSLPSYPGLTERESECVYHLSLGHTAKETAEHLGLSFRTVEYYLSNIKDKIKCNRKSEIISVLLSLKNKSKNC